MDITKDFESVDPNFPPEMCGLFIEERLLGQIYLANGNGPHPTVLLLHGFPGYEKNLDLAQMLRRGGYNVVIFHYSGSWGSKGSYSFSQDYLDVYNVRTTITKESFSKRFRIDRDSIYLVGHSVGGFLTLLAARNSLDFRGFAALAPYNLSLQAKRINAGEKGVRDEVLSLFSNGLDPLNGATAESLIADIIRNQNQWDILDDERIYSSKNVFLAIANFDTVATPSIHQLPIADVLQKSGGSKTILSFSSSHDFPEKRVALCEAIYDWLEMGNKK